MRNDILVVFASAVAGAASIVFVLRTAIKILAPEAFKTPGRLGARVYATHDAASIRPLPTIQMTLQLGRSALSATDPVAGNSQAGFRSEQESNDHWSSKIPQYSVPVI